MDRNWCFAFPIAQILVLRVSVIFSTTVMGSKLFTLNALLSSSEKNDDLRTKKNPHSIERNSYPLNHIHSNPAFVR